MIKILVCLYIAIHIFAGAADINFAIQNFQKGRYFRFGFWVIICLMTISPMLVYITRNV